MRRLAPAAADSPGEGRAFDSRRSAVAAGSARRVEQGEQAAGQDVAAQRQRSPEARLADGNAGRGMVAMSWLLIVGLKNAVLVLPLAVLALAAGRWARRPALAHV